MDIVWLCGFGRLFQGLDVEQSRPCHDLKATVKLELVLTAFVLRPFVTNAASCGRQSARPRDLVRLLSCNNPDCMRWANPPFRSCCAACGDLRLEGHCHTVDFSNRQRNIKCTISANEDRLARPLRQQTALPSSGRRNVAPVESPEPLQPIQEDDEPVEVVEEGAAHASSDVVTTTTQAVTESVATLGSDVAWVVVHASV